MVVVKKKDGESFDSLIRRFKKKMQMSGKMLTVKRGMYYKKTKSRFKKKQDAKRRQLVSKFKKEYDELCGGHFDVKEWKQYLRKRMEEN